MEKIISITDTSFFIVSLFSILFSISFFLIKRIYLNLEKDSVLSMRRARFKILSILAVLILSILYFGFIETSLIITILIGSFLIGFKIFFFKDDLLISFVAGFFVLLGIYLVTSLIINPQLGILAIFLLCLISLLLKSNVNKKFFTELSSGTFCFLSKLNLFEVFLLSLCFTIGSFPQVHWDAVQNNLYIAKQYIASNSLQPLEEAIPSLFPQNAIVYYSLFYQLGDVRGLQIAYIFPLVILISLVKKFVNRFRLESWKIFIYGLIFTPIVLFQSANGYYDLFILILILSAIYILLMKKNSFKGISIAVFLIGLASGAKHFPVVFIFLPVLIFLVFGNNHKRVLNTAFLILIGLLPLGIWIIRSYLFIGSPIFPFFQNIFPTPEYWPMSDVLENNPMIKTPMSALNWLSGGSLIYPILTFFFTEKYIEATLGYSGLAFIFLIPFQLVILIVVIRRILSRNFLKLDIIFIYVFCAYILVGLITRYYRYLWPFQLTLAFLSIIYLKNLSFFEKSKKSLLKVIAVIILSLNFLGITIFFQEISPPQKFLFKPDYYFTSSDANLITFLNNETAKKGNVVVLDASKHAVGRFNFRGKIYTCNWYWLNVYNNWKRWQVEDAFRRDTIVKFNYVITDSETHVLCNDLVKKQIDKFNPIYMDSKYIIYKVI